MQDRVDRPERTGGKVPERFGVRCADKPIDPAGAVDFWAPWCGPCKSVLRPEIRKGRDVAGIFVVAKVLTPKKCRSLAQRYRVTAIPTMVLLYIIARC